MLKLGWILLVVGILLGIFGTIFLTESKAGLAFLELLVCDDNESLVRINTTSVDGDAAFSFHCQKDDGGDLVDVNAKLIPVIGVLFLPLILSFPFILMGTRRRTKRAVTPAQSN